MQLAKTPTIGKRNQLAQEPRYYRAVQGRPGAPNSLALKRLPSAPIAQFEIGQSGDYAWNKFGSGFSTWGLAYICRFYPFYKKRTSIFQSLTGKSFGNKILQTLSAKSSLNQKGQMPSGQLPNNGDKGSILLLQIAQTVSGRLSTLKIVQISSGRL